MEPSRKALLTRANLHRGVEFVQIYPLVGSFVQTFRSGIRNTIDIAKRAKEKATARCQQVWKYNRRHQLQYTCRDRFA